MLISGDGCRRHVDCRTIDGQISHCVCTDVSLTVLKVWCGENAFKLYNGLVIGLARLLGCRPYHPIWWLCRNNRRLKTDVGSVPVQWTRTNTNCRLSDDCQPDGIRYIRVNHRTDHHRHLLSSLFTMKQELHLKIQMNK